MVLPLTLMKSAINNPTMVELKSGETYNGHLVNIDSWMNICLREVVCTSRDGDRFWRMPECYIRGNTIKFLRIPNEVLDTVRDESAEKRAKMREGGGRGRGHTNFAKSNPARGVYNQAGRPGGNDSKPSKVPRQ